MKRRQFVFVAFVAAATAASSASAQDNRAPQTCMQLVAETKPGLPDETKYNAIVALGARGPAAACAIEPLRALTRDSNFQIRAAAVVALGKIGPGAMRALPDLMARWNDEEVAGEDIVEALHGLGPGAIPRLATYLNAGRAFGEVAANAPHPIASRALAAFGSEAVPTLTRALGPRRTRWAAAAALRQIGSPSAPAVPALVAAYDAKGSDEWDRSMILAAIFDVGERACAARPLLERLAISEPKRLGISAPLLAPQDNQYKQIETTLAKLSGCL